MQKRRRETRDGIAAESVKAGRTWTPRGWLVGPRRSGCRCVTNRQTRSFNVHILFISERSCPFITQLNITSSRVDYIRIISELLAKREVTLARSRMHGWWIVSRERPKVPNATHSERLFNSRIHTRSFRSWIGSCTIPSQPCLVFILRL